MPTPVLHAGDTVTAETGKASVSQSSRFVEGRQTLASKHIRDARVVQSTVNETDGMCGRVAGGSSRSGIREDLSEEGKSDQDPKEETEPVT